MFRITYTYIFRDIIYYIFKESYILQYPLKHAVVVKDHLEILVMI